MTNKYYFEAVDRSLRDIMKSVREELSAKPFGGITTVLGGDFWKILPVIPKGDRQDIIQACIKTSYLWQVCEVHSLQQNMRLKADNLDSASKEQMRHFANWILDIGNGKHCPDSGVRSIVDNIYQDLEGHVGESNFLVPRAILTPTNETVDLINDHILERIPTEESIYFSSDSICKADFHVEDQDLLYPTEFLNTLKFPGFPPHTLRLKKGAAIRLLKNLNQGSGLCNGTRLKIT
ncbi:uncharacterized protein LOC107627631 [Arachis ipaensis]|uniref:uncharacterized protein LOC107627631 n=1 Tax=Arachis ipaensis TaxID=130454 RepID=UPI0007AF6B9D|nr:uncharacterized protein LOC107627631 [Arachis ipaensis]